MILIDPAKNTKHLCQEHQCGANRKHSGMRISILHERRANNTVWMEFSVVTRSQPSFLTEKELYIHIRVRAHTHIYMSRLLVTTKIAKILILHDPWIIIAWVVYIDTQDISLSSTIARLGRWDRRTEGFIAILLHSNCVFVNRAAVLIAPRLFDWYAEESSLSTAAQLAVGLLQLLGLYNT